MKQPHVSGSSSVHFHGDKADDQTASTDCYRLEAESAMHAVRRLLHPLLPLGLPFKRRRR